jgi:hypothetical protein
MPAQRSSSVARVEASCEVVGWRVGDAAGWRVVDAAC